MFFPIFYIMTGKQRMCSHLIQFLLKFRCLHSSHFFFQIYSLPIFILISRTASPSQALHPVILFEELLAYQVSLNLSYEINYEIFTKTNIYIFFLILRSADRY